MVSSFIPAWAPSQLLVTPDSFRGPALHKRYRLLHVGCRNKSGMTTSSGGRASSPPDRSPSARRRRSTGRSEERRVGKSVSVRVDLGGRRIIKKKNHSTHNT